MFAARLLRSPDINYKRYEWCNKWHQAAISSVHELGKIQALIDNSSKNLAPVCQLIHCTIASNLRRATWA